MIFTRLGEQVVASGHACSFRADSVFFVSDFLVQSFMKVNPSNQGPK
jgi:hypothetical protein